MEVRHKVGKERKEKQRMVETKYTLFLNNYYDCLTTALEMNSGIHGIGCWVVTRPGLDVVGASEGQFRSPLAPARTTNVGNLEVIHKLLYTCKNNCWRWKVIQNLCALVKQILGRGSDSKVPAHLFEQMLEILGDLEVPVHLLERQAMEEVRDSKVPVLAPYLYHVNL